MNMRRHDDFLDKLLSAEIKKMIDNIPPPDSEKAYNNIKKRLDAYYRRKTLLKRAASVAVLLVVFISGILVGTGNASTADIWFIKSFKSLFDNSLNIKITTDDNSLDTGQNVPPETNLGMEAKLVSLEDALLVLKQPIFMPTYIPLEYSFHGIYIDQPVQEAAIIEVQFINGENKLINIKQIPLKLTTSIAYNVGSSDVKTVMINGREATLIKLSNRSQLIWDNYATQFILTAPLDDDELIKMANSLKPSD